MRARCLILVSSLCMTGSLQAGAAFEEPTTGYRVTVPEGWRHHHDKAKAALLLAGPAGIRIRVETRVTGSDMGKTDVANWYRSDGRKLQAASAGLKVTQKPELLEPTLLGGHKTWNYGLAYKAREGVFQAEAWLASAPGRNPGSFLQAGSFLQVRVLAYAPGKKLDDEGKAIDGFLASFRWPKQEFDPNPVRVDEDGGDVAVVVNPPPLDKDPLDDRPATDRPRAVKQTSSGEGFDNGSLQGGLGVMASGGAIRDERRLRAFGAASRVSTHARTKEERERAAGYMGFGKQ